MPTVPTQAVDTVANTLFVSLTADAPQPVSVDLTDAKFSFQKDSDSDLYGDIPEISIEKLTEVDVDGDGVFDQLMSAVDEHIKREFKDQRITGDQYAEVYTQAINSVLANATQFVLSKDKARWDAVAAQMQARIVEINATTAMIDLERAKIDAAKLQFDMLTSASQYALTKMQIANSEAEHQRIDAMVAKEIYEVDYVLPSQRALVDEQMETQRGQTLSVRSDGITPIGGILAEQKDSLNLDVQTKTYALANTLPTQLQILQEQRESERAKTMDTRTDGAVVEGSVGKQKDLYDQQIDSFVKDAQYKTAKMYLDGWITQKTLDEGLLAPTELQNTGVDAVLAGVRSNNSL